MATSDKTYAVMVDANNKLLFPTAETFIEANTELGGGRKFILIKWYSNRCYI